MKNSGVTERDGSFRRLIQTVKRYQDDVSRRHTKRRVPVSGSISLCIHKRMKALAEQRTERADRLVSTSHVYNDAARLFVNDLEQLLGRDLCLPAGALTLSGVLGLRELVDRPVLTPLRDLALRADEQHRTTIYLDPQVWDALIEVSLQFGLQLRRTFHVQPLLKLAAAWYLAGFDFEHY